ncbi:MAG: hypothetical protein KZQ90_04720 [Candidatus Thiodiazotropha sp. (ex Codakia rugifera)]|nr:hypothetical protein [Candidatus Thiodiazotropha sp. (ex Codakia rugifera)]
MMMKTISTQPLLMNFSILIQTANTRPLMANITAYSVIKVGLAAVIRISMFAVARFLSWRGLICLSITRVRRH